MFRRLLKKLGAWLKDSWRMPSAVEVLKKLSDPAEMARVYRLQIGACPACNRSLEGHRIAVFSAAPFSGAKDWGRIRLDELISDRKWSEARDIREWRNDSDLLEYDALECPNGVMVLIRFVSPLDSLSGSWMDSTVLVEHRDAAEIARLVDGSWINL